MPASDEHVELPPEFADTDDVVGVPNPPANIREALDRRFEELANNSPTPQITQDEITAEDISSAERMLDNEISRLRDQRSFREEDISSRNSMLSLHNMGLVSDETLIREMGRTIDFASIHNPISSSRSSTIDALNDALQDYNVQDANWVTPVANTRAVGSKSIDSILSKINDSFRRMVDTSLFHCFVENGKNIIQLESIYTTDPGRYNYNLNRGEYYGNEIYFRNVSKSDVIVLDIEGWKKRDIIRDRVGNVTPRNRFSCPTMVLSLHNMLRIFLFNWGMVFESVYNYKTFVIYGITTVNSSIEDENFPIRKVDNEIIVNADAYNRAPLVASWSKDTSDGASDLDMMLEGNQLAKKENCRFGQKKNNIDL